MTHEIDAAYYEANHADISMVRLVRAHASTQCNKRAHASTQSIHTVQSVPHTAHVAHTVHTAHMAHTVHTIVCHVHSALSTHSLTPPDRCAVLIAALC